MPRIIVKPPTVIFIVLLGLADRSVLSLLPLAAALLHELGHLTAMLICGCRVREVEITIFGAEIKAPFDDCDTLKTVVVYGSGGAFNLMCAAVVMLLPMPCFEVRFFGACSLALAAVNLLPIRLLDGGAIMDAVLKRVLPAYADKVSAVISASVLLILWLVSAFLLLLYGGNVSLLLFCMYLFAALYLH